MDRDNYSMDFDARRDYVYDKAIAILEGNDDVFVEACEALDAWNGFLGDSRCNDMDMIDDFFSRPSELLDKMDDFNANDSYFYFTAYGYVSTTDDKHSVYSDDYSASDVLDALIDNYSNVDVYNDTLNQLLEIINNDDFCIEDDWSYDEVDNEDDMPEETDDEFTDRIDNIVD